MRRRSWPLDAESRLLASIEHPRGPVTPPFPVPVYSDNQSLGCAWLPTRPKTNVSAIVRGGVRLP